VIINEAIIVFRGRIFHKVKIKNKPIDEEFKTWITAQSGYTITWRWHSKLEGPEGVPRDGIDVSIVSISTVHLAPTFAVILSLAQLLRDVYSD
jgi:hypothetical protein